MSEHDEMWLSVGPWGAYASGDAVRLWVEGPNEHGQAVADVEQATRLHEALGKALGLGKSAQQVEVDRLTRLIREMKAAHRETLQAYRRQIEGSVRGLYLVSVHYPGEREAGQHIITANSAHHAIDTVLDMAGTRPELGAWLRARPLGELTEKRIALTDTGSAPSEDAFDRLREVFGYGKSWAEMTDAILEMVEEGRV